MNREYIRYQELVRKRFAKDVQYAKERGLSTEDMIRIICNIDAENSVDWRNVPVASKSRTGV
jgi:hypothetical protein